MMSQMAPRDRSGAYIRPASQFRHWVNAEPENPYSPAAGRYQLIVGMSCPWAHRTLVVWALKGLEAAIGVTLVVPAPLEGGWVFPQSPPELGDLGSKRSVSDIFKPSHHFSHRSLAELYQQAQSGYSGRNTVPVLWDTQTQTIVNNESSELIVMLNAAWNEFAQHPELDLYPTALQPDIDAWNEKTYHAINNGVYRCGFAQTQAAYTEACTELFAALDEIETTLATRRYLCGDRVTLADVRLFTTLVRFDPVYYSLFKCDRQRIQDYPNLGAYLRDLYQLPGVAATCDLNAVRQDYYGNLFPLNPGGIVPLSADLSHLLVPHHRDAIAASVE